MEMFSTPDIRYASTGDPEKTYLPKPEIINLLQSIDFTGIYYSPFANSDSPDNTPEFLQVLCQELQNTLINELQRGITSKKLLTPSTDIPMPSASYNYPALSLHRLDADVEQGQFDIDILS